MKASRFLITLILGFGWCIFFNCSLIHAAGMPVTVQLQLPAHNKSDSVINLDVKPQQKVDFAVILHNPTADNATIQIAPAIAKTNSSGAIFLGDSSRQLLDNSWRYRLQDLGLVPKTVTVKSHSTKSVPFSLLIPNYQGSISGSIIVRPVTKIKKKSQFPNQIQQAYGVLLNVGNYDQLTAKFNLGKVHVMSQGGRSLL
ncbi:DUF916 domain-containing protein, partial [Lactobacillus sp. XV13L]|nr:DUF916 domain-containing protein [Lactobacillus sp. XV13L]